MNELEGVPLPEWSATNISLQVIRQKPKNPCVHGNWGPHVFAAWLCFFFFLSGLAASQARLAPCFGRNVPIVIFR